MTNCAGHGGVWWCMVDKHNETGRLISSVMLVLAFTP